MSNGNNQSFSIMDNTKFLDLPEKWQIENGRFFDFTKFRSIIVCRYRLEDRRAIVFQHARGNLAITLIPAEIIYMRRGLDLHWLTDYAVKIEAGSRISVPDMPER